MKALMMLLTLFTGTAWAGCIGPVIMGQCEGESVPWDTHPNMRDRTRQASPGFYWDKRGTVYQRRNPGAVDPFTGRDPHDPSWFTGQ